MKPSKNCFPTGTSAVRREIAHNDAPPLDVSADTNGGFFAFKQQISQHKMVDNVLKQSKSFADPDPAYEKEFPSLSAHNDAPPLDVSADAKVGFFDFKQQISQHKMVDNVLKQSKSCFDPDPAYEKEFPSLSVSIGSGSNSQHKMVDNVLKQSKSCFDPDPAYEKEFPSLSVSIGSGSKGKTKRRTRIDLRTQTEEGEPADAAGSLQFETSHTANATSQQDDSSLPTSCEPADAAGSLQFETSHTANATSQQDDSSLPTSFKMNRGSYFNRRPKLHQTFPTYVVETGNSDCTEYLPILEPFDICPPKSRKYVALKPSWRVTNRENLTELEYSTEEFEPVLRPGMVLLKRYITLNEQVEIVKKCQELGLGPGGFYQPGYQDGAKLRLQMMCLGRNWDPQTKYENQCRVDGSKPPGIPRAFILLVNKVLQDSQALIKKTLEASNVEDILPGMSPDICIVNFYTTNGRLGLHQDRDESRRSLLKELPVVSFSVGDSAELLYGDQRDVNKAEKILLESGDVLIFGGKSRHIFHGVKSIVPNSAPSSLLNESKLRPGRLNLTFRQF